MSESQSSAPLDENGAAQIFSQMLDETPKEEKPEASNAASDDSVEVFQKEVQPEAEEGYAEEPKKFTIKVDGKDVEVSESELAEAYKSGLRQSDYTKKTMEVAEQRKAADAEMQRAAQERQEYAKQLSEHEAVLQHLLNEQSQINWQHLLDSDPVEYLKQRHLFQERQAALDVARNNKEVLRQRESVEQQHAQANYLKAQQEELLAKLPDWKDTAKAVAEVGEVREWLLGNGFSKQEVDNVFDHRHVITARKAMLYDKMMAKASVAAKKVESLPAKVERPGVQTNAALDKRSANWQRLSQTGKIEDAASLLTSFL